jgi:hypothetical protein
MAGRVRRLADNPCTASSALGELGVGEAMALKFTVPKFVPSPSIRDRYVKTFDRGATWRATWCVYMGGEPTEEA